MKRLLSAPGRALRNAWVFIDPPLKVGRIPYARTVVILQLIAALVFVGYTLDKKGVRFPFTAKPYFVDVILPDAKGLDPAKQPAAAVAGVGVGKVTKVRLDRGKARVTLRLPARLRGRVFRDATAFIRPASVLQTLVVNVLPGDPRSGPLPADVPIAAQRTGSYVHVDELTSVLDADTQAQVQVLISEASRALDGREPQIRRILSQVGKLTDTATPLARALDDRRRLLGRLTSHLDQLFGTLGDRGTQLAEVVALASRTLRVTAAREPQLRDATRQLAPTVRELGQSLAASRDLADSLTPALDALLPTARKLDPATAGMRRLVPDLDRTWTALGLLTKVGARPARLFANGLQGLNGKLRRDQVPALQELVALAEVLYGVRHGLVDFANNVSSAASTNRRAGVTVNASLVELERLDPSDLGLPGQALRSATGGPSKPSRQLAELLERTCRDSNSIACAIRFTLPGLPDDPILGQSGKGR